MNTLKLFGFVFLFCGIISLMCYFHTIDNLVNYQSMSIEDPLIEIYEVGLVGNYIGGYESQHLIANKLFALTFICTSMGFILLFVGEVEHQGKGGKT